jgi:hypothetical protein
VRLKQHIALCLLFLASFPILLVIKSSKDADAVEITVNEIQNQESRFALIFFHGLGGHPVDTFTNKETNISWFELIQRDLEILPDGCTGRELDVFSVDYSQVFFTRLRLSDISHALAIKQQLRNIVERREAVWFVAYSMGGLVAKRIILEWDRTGYRNLASTVKGFVQLAVPNSGSHLADSAEKWGFASLLRYFGISSSFQVRDLKTPESGSDLLRSLKSDWEGYVAGREKLGNKIYVRCAAETEPEKFNFSDAIVVKALYAADNSCVGELFDVGVSHSELPKPRSNNSQIAEFLRVSLTEGSQYFPQLPCAKEKQDPQAAQPQEKYFEIIKDQ